MRGSRFGRLVCLFLATPLGCCWGWAPPPRPLRVSPDVSRTDALTIEAIELVLAARAGGGAGAGAGRVEVARISSIERRTRQAARRAEGSASSPSPLDGNRRGPRAEDARSSSGGAWRAQKARAAARVASRGARGGGGVGRANQPTARRAAPRSAKPPIETKRM
jgi:hypothetical protein